MALKRITSVGLATAAFAALAPAAAAAAGSYHVYSCRAPAGEAAPADGWVGTKSGTYSYAEDTCPAGGALIAGLGDQAARTANTDSATWAFSAPEGERVAGATVWRAGDADGGAAVNATYEFWLAGPTEGEVFDQCSYLSGCNAGSGDASHPFAPSNRIAVPATNLGGRLFVKAACGGVSEYKCREAQGDPNNYAAVVYLFAADILLEQTAGPSVSGVSGELATAGALAGTSDVAFSASDPGSGAYEALFSVDGQLVQSAVLDENGGRCRNVGQSADGLPAFLYARPCLASLSADVGFDTTRLSNGAHHLVVTVIDAAGNAAPVLDRNITVANPSLQAPAGAPGPASSTGGSGPLNGVNASSQASLTVAWRESRGIRLASPYGRAHVIVGRLAGPGGVPIGGAQLDISATPSSAGAAAVAMTGPRTAGDGTFTVRVPASASSRVLHFGYRVHLGDPLPVVTRTLVLSVRAAVRLSIGPRVTSVGHTIFFTGAVQGRPIPPGGKALVLEASSAGGSWIKFNVVHTNHGGRFRASYRFRFPGPASYRFRVLCEAEGDYPFAASASNAVSVLER
jgi:hypothetical protein